MKSLNLEEQYVDKAVHKTLEHNLPSKA